MDSDTIDSFWSEVYFGCGREKFDSGRDIVCPHAYLHGYNGVFIMKRNGYFIISAPEDKTAVFENVVNRGYDLFDPSLLHNLLSESFSRYIGPSWIGYPETIRPAHPPSTRLLGSGKNGWPVEMDHFQRSCGETEWSYSGINHDSTLIAAQFVGSRIVSAASFELWDGNVAHIGIITRPDYRGRGYAQNVLALLTGVIWKRGYIPQYRTLCSNTPAIRVACGCGYSEYASHISIRLNSPI